MAASARRLAILVAAIVSLPFAVLAQPDDETRLEDTFPRAAIVIQASASACYDFDVYLASTGTQQRRGLMYVRNLPAFSGMLFVYPQSGRRSMWMKNTYLSLDILFIREDGTVSSIAQNTEPLSLDSITSAEAVSYVLELNAGITEALRVDEQSRVFVPSELSATN